MRFPCPHCGAILEYEHRTDGAAELVCGHCERPVELPKGILEGGSVLGDFVIRERLAAGGMGEVFLAHQGSLDRDVALKVLLPCFAEDETVSSEFLREACSAASLNHPNIVQVYAAGKSDGRCYYAMEHVEGQTLRQRLEDGRFSVEMVMNIAEAMSSALEYAWRERRMIHRDVKPENILLTQGGTPKLTDFGLAMCENRRDNGEVFGTPQYVAPEIIFGQPATVQSDIYSLGATLYHLLTGRSPYVAGDGEDMLNLHLTEPLTPVRELRPDVPRPLAALLEAMLAKRPVHRIADYAVLRMELSRVQAGRMPEHAVEDKAQMPLLPEEGEPLAVREGVSGRRYAAEEEQESGRRCMGKWHWRGIILLLLILVGGYAVWRCWKAGVGQRPAPEDAAPVHAPESPRKEDVFFEKKQVQGEKTGEEEERMAEWEQRHAANVRLWRQKWAEWENESRQLDAVCGQWKEREEEWQALLKRLAEWRRLWPQETPLLEGVAKVEMQRDAWESLAAEWRRYGESVKALRTEGRACGNAPIAETQAEPLEKEIAKQKPLALLQEQVQEEETRLKSLERLSADAKKKAEKGTLILQKSGNFVAERREECARLEEQERALQRAEKIRQSEEEKVRAQRAGERLAECRRKICRAINRLDFAAAERICQELQKGNNSLLGEWGRKQSALLKRARRALGGLDGETSAESGVVMNLFQHVQWVALEASDGVVRGRLVLEGGGEGKKLTLEDSWPVALLLPPQLLKWRMGMKTENAGDAQEISLDLCAYQLCRGLNTEGCRRYLEKQEAGVREREDVRFMLEEIPHLSGEEYLEGVLGALARYPDALRLRSREFLAWYLKKYMPEEYGKYEGRLRRELLRERPEDGENNTAEK